MTQSEGAAHITKTMAEPMRNSEYIPVLTIFFSEFKVNFRPPGVRDDFPGFSQIPGSAKNPELVSNMAQIDPKVWPFFKWANICCL